MSLLFLLKKDIGDTGYFRMGYGAFYRLREELKRKSRFDFEYLEGTEISVMTPEEYAFYDFMTEDDCDGEISNENCKLLYQEFMDLNIDGITYKLYEILMKSLRAAIDNGTDLRWE